MDIMNIEEYEAKAMLLGMEAIATTIPPSTKFTVLFRKRVRTNIYPGTALFSYYDADTLEPIASLTERSEVDMTLEERFKLMGKANR